MFWHILTSISVFAMTVCNIITVINLRKIERMQKEDEEYAKHLQYLQNQTEVQKHPSIDSRLSKH